MDSLVLAENALIKRDERMIENHGHGASEGAMVIVQRHIDRAAEVVCEKLEAEPLRGGHKKRPRLDLVDTLRTACTPELIALVALQGALDSVASCLSLNDTYKHLGKMIAAEVFAWSLKRWDKRAADRIERKARRNNNSGHHRRQAARSMAKKAGFKPGRWKDTEVIAAGVWLVEVVLRLDDVFHFVPPDEQTNVDPYITIAQEALEYSETMVRQLIDAHPVPLPLLSPPPAWKDATLRIEAHGAIYEVPLVRKEHCQVTWSYLREAITKGTMRPVLDSLSRIQDTAWMINQEILDIVCWCFKQELEIDGLPPAKDVPMPPRFSEEEWGLLTEAQQKAHRRDISAKITINRGYVGQRETLKRDIETARYIVGQGGQFWTPVNLDYRGRVYPTCAFQFQRQDYVRALFKFAQGKPLGADGLYWLMVHLANSGDFEKVSKKALDERVAWTKANERAILETWAFPKSMQHWWGAADKPFVFLAACFEYGDAIYSGNPSTFVSHLPVSFDGTCSGLQHYAAMTRCEVTAPLVNLLPSQGKADVYQTVADAVVPKVQALSTQDSRWGKAAPKALAYGIDRNLVKRNVMTWGYSSKERGMRDQLMDDVMVPLSDKVLLGKLPEHPFQIEEDTWTPKGSQESITVPGFNAAGMLASTTFATIEETLSRPAEAMRFLRGIARALAHEGRPVVWHTPLGLPVVHHYPNKKITKVQLYLQDRSVRVRTVFNVAEEDKGIDKSKSANAIAPNFVHSYDACHLMMVVNSCAYRGIHSFALVHDSFGCHASDARIFRETIQTEFCGLYQDHDVLQDILDEAYDQLTTNHSRLPQPPARGTYDIKEVLNAVYAFS